MVFTSWIFGLFLPVVVVGHRLLRGRSRVWLLLAASYVFYAAWDPRFLGLIWISTGADYLLARRMPFVQGAQRRWLLGASVAVNLGILGFFKYWNFFADSAATFLETVGLRANPSSLAIILPIGISFYTFQTLGYTIDVYRGRIAPETRLDVFALFVAYFPQLVAGPIERAERLMPQLADTGRVGTRSDVREGLWLIGRGLFRKLAIADAVAPYVQTVFADPSGHARTALVMGVVGFSLQIYGDFAGYTDIARGSARLMGVHLSENFRQPYMARSITEFWRRWHISLSEWLRDYLYIPLGGNRRGRLHTYRNLMVTMLLGGLWHGAAWTFVIWGGLHGLYLSVERFMGRDRLNGRKPLWMAVTLAVVGLTWIPFRAENLEGAWEYARGLVLGGGEPLSATAFTVVSLAVLLTVLVDRMELASGDTNPLTARPAIVEGLAYGTALVATIVLSGASTVPFIYFQF
jgi:alginate O-acetyltransferase complex protein AlgI